MEHNILISSLPENFTPDGDMVPFSTVRLEKMSLRINRILTPCTVGVRCLGYYRTAEGFSGTGEENDAALAYGLMTAQFRLSGSPDDLKSLFGKRQSELLAEINAVLEQSESPVRFAEIVFGYADTCVHDGSLGASSQRYSGFVIGRTSTREVTVHRPKGIPGEWQCVCGAYSAPGEVCEECGIRRPVL